MRRDKRGRRIGYNWWREYIFDLWFTADHVWQLDREAVTHGYETEEREFAERFPRPTFKDFLVRQSGMSKKNTS